MDIRPSSRAEDDGEKEDAGKTNSKKVETNRRRDTPESIQPGIVARYARIASPNNAALALHFDIKPRHSRARGFFFPGVYLVGMGYLQNVGVGLLLFLSSILAGALGLFHISRPAAAPPTQTTAATRTATSTGTAVGYSNDLTPCDNDTNIPTDLNVPILDGHGLATGLFRHGNCIYFTTPAFSGGLELQRRRRDVCVA